MMGATRIAIGVAMALLATGAAAQTTKLANDQPIEVSSDKLDVYQDQHKAIFTGNVIAVQGTTTMRATQMVVFYTSDDAKPAAAPAATPAPDKSAGQGIQRIEATGNVVFTTPEETAQGDMGIYNVETDTIDLMGKNVTLTRGQNVLKGTKLNYNMGTGRSVLTSGGTAVGGGPSATGKPARVHGLFVPKSDKK